MNDVRRVWLVGALVLAVAATATASATAKAPVSAQSLPGQGAFEQACSSLGGTFSLKELGGPRQRYECAGVSEAADPVLRQVCVTYPDLTDAEGGGGRGARAGIASCTRSGVAPIKVTVGPKVRIVNSSLVVVEVKSKCSSDFGLQNVSVQISQPGGSGTGGATVVCTNDWTSVEVSVTGGAFTPGQADVTALGTINGLMGDRDVRQLQVESG
jgi:hypothetical protein